MSPEIRKIYFAMLSKNDWQRKIVKLLQHEFWMPAGWVRFDVITPGTTRSVENKYHDLTILKPIER